MNKPLAKMAIAMVLQTLIAPASAGTHTSADTMFKSADSADVTENFTVAKTKYLDLISKLRQSDPANPMIIRAQTRLARIYIFQRDFDKAEPIFHILMHTAHRKLDLEPELMIDLDDLSEAYENLHDDPRHGLESLEHSLAVRKFINPNHPRVPDSYRSLAEHCVTTSNLKQSIDWISKSIEIEKHYPLKDQSNLVSDQTFLSIVYLAANDVDRAQQTAHVALDTVARCACGKNQLPQLHANLGRIYSRKGLFDQADKEYQLSLQTMPPKDNFAKGWPKYIMRYRQENDSLARKAKAGHH